MDSPARQRVTMLSGTLVALVGAGFVLIAINHSLAEISTPIHFLLGGVFPILLGCGTIIGGLWVAQSNLAPTYVRRVLAWWLFAIAIAILLGVTITVYERSHGIILVDVIYVVTNTMTAGSTGGLLIGYFDARRQYRADQLTMQREQLEILNRVVRHDIQNDMNVVTGWLDMLEPHVEESGTDALERVQRTSEHILELAHNARDYVSIIVGDSEPDIEPTDLTALLRDEIQARQDTYPDAEFVVPNDLPAVTIEATDMLRSAFRNILNNAVRHNDTNDPRVTVTVEEHEETVVINIADNGPGIPDTQKESVFGKNARGLDSPGTGIGLYLVQTIITEFGGTVHIEDNDPRGAIFVIELPRTNDRQPPATG